MPDPYTLVIKGRSLFFFLFFNCLSFDFGSHIAWHEIFTGLLLCELSNFWRFGALIS